MKNFFDFIKSKTFVKHLAISFALLFVIMWAVLKWLDTYTHHGELIEVPDFTGVKITDLDNFIKDKKVRYTIIDSVYDPKAPKGAVVRQEPEKKINVKENRTIYLYVTTTLPPRVSMPKLKDKSLRQALSILESYGLRAGRMRYVPDQCVNCVLEQLIKKKKVAPGTLVPKGSVVELIVGKGLSDEKVMVPNLIGLTYAEALDKLAEFSLNEGALRFEANADSTRARIYRQIPAPTKDATVNMGSSVDMFFTTKKEQVQQSADSSVTE
ncbi:MAG: PASTA domain-containing protein [Bacteroidia bacterium]|nr:PASTA domain-containing protein [Bacteroidia bacterium]